MPAKEKPATTNQLTPAPTSPPPAPYAAAVSPPPDSGGGAGGVGPALADIRQRYNDLVNQALPPFRDTIRDISTARSYDVTLLPRIHALDAAIAKAESASAGD